MIYFIQAGDNGPVKIGSAHDPEKRLRSLQTGSALPLRLVAVLPGGPHVEKAIHKACAKSRIQGEWFEPTGRLAQILEEILDGSYIPPFTTLTRREREERRARLGLEDM